MFLEVDCPSPQPDQIFAALSKGSFGGQKGNLRLPSSGVLPEELFTEFESAHARSYRMRQFFKNGKSILERLGLTVPESVKAQLRKIF